MEKKLGMETTVKFEFGSSVASNLLALSFVEYSSSLVLVLFTYIE